MATDLIVARRGALVAICEPAARSVIDRVVNEAVHAAHIFGLTRERADIGELAVAARAVSESNHIPAEFVAFADLLEDRLFSE